MKKKLYSRKADKVRVGKVVNVKYSVFDKNNWGKACVL